MFLTVLAIIVIIIGLCGDYKNHHMKYSESTNPNVIRNKKACEEIYARTRKEYEQRTGKKADW